MGGLGLGQPPYPGAASTPGIAFDQGECSEENTAISAAAITEDHFGEWLALDFYRLVIGVIIVGIGVGKLAHEADVEHVLLNYSPR